MIIKDYSVSGEEFELVYNAQYDLYQTIPVPEQLDKYYETENYISHTDSNKGWFDALYQYVKKINLKHKINLIKDYKAQSSLQLLDIGAGTGDFLKICKQQQWQITGVEPSIKAQEKAREKGIVLESDYHKLPMHTYDVITLWHVLEHLPNIETTVHTIANLLKDNGLLVIAVPNYRSWDAQHYQQYWAAYDVPRHLWHFSEDSIKRLFAKEGLKVIAKKPMLFDAFYVSMLSEQYKTGKKSFIKGVFNGLRSNLCGMIKGEYSSQVYLLGGRREL